jgi:hypothetical protein
VKIEIEDGVLILRTPESISRVTSEMREGTFWEYVSKLIEDDVKQSVVSSQLEELIGLVNGLAEKGIAVPLAPVAATKELKEEKKEEKVVKPLDMSKMGNLKTLLNRAKGMGRE